VKERPDNSAEALTHLSEVTDKMHGLLMGWQAPDGGTSGPSRHWVKTKCPDWKRDNTARWRIFNQPEPTERQRVLVRKREELARVLDQLRTPGLRRGIARELRKHVAILEREIAELEQG
jgi:hypothetical protein